MDWTQFSFDFRLNNERLGDELIAIEAYKHAALNLVLPPDWKEQLDRLNRVRAVHGTTALEGNPLSETEVNEQMERMADDQSTEQFLLREQLQIRNAGWAQEWVRHRFVPDSRPIQLNDLLHMHELVTQDSDEQNNQPGRLRRHPVVVGTMELGGVHRGAPYEDLPGLMEEFFDFVNTRALSIGVHPVVRALMAHFFLVTLHPFGDGNGRISRLVEAGLLYEKGYNVHGFYGLSNYFYRNADQYKLLLQKSRRKIPFDLTEFVHFGLAGFASELRGINSYIKNKLNRVVYRDMLLRALGTLEGKRRRIINQREYNLLNYLLRETEPTDPFSPEPSRRIGYDELLKAPFIQAAYGNVTRRTFHRELVRLADRGFVEFQLSEDEFIITIDFDAIGKY